MSGESKLKVKIGVTDYELKMDSTANLLEDYMEMTDETNGGMLVGGVMNPMLNTIRINKDYPNQTKKQSFLHECVHALLDELGQDDLFEDESFVDSFSKQLYGFYMNNNLEKIFKFLEGKENGKS
jgi:hypothetical protein